MSRRIIIAAGLIFVGIQLAACQQMDPYTRMGTWQPNGANAGNIAAQVADPYDLIRGRSVARVDTRNSNIAIGHIWADQPKGLLDPGGGGGSGNGGGSSGSSSSGSGSGNSSGSGGAPSGG